MTDTKDDLLRLAERAEKASGPDRELDALIWCAVCPADLVYGIEEWHAGSPRPAHLESVGLTLPQWLEKWPDQTHSVAKSYAVLCYTASIDAAMKLVPEGRGVMFFTFGDGLGEAQVGGANRSKAATAALAITAASLRARAAA